jgi:hypothetical protein
MTAARTSVDDHVRRVVAQAPPLTDFQRDRLAVLLRQDAESRPPQAGDTQHRTPGADK